MNPLRLGIFSGLQQMRDRRDEREDRKLARESREAAKKQQALTLEMAIRDKGYIPDAEAGPDASLSGRQLDAIVGGATGVPTVGMKDTGTRYGAGPAGYKHDRMSPGAERQRLDDVVKRSQLDYTKALTADATARAANYGGSDDVNWQTIETKDGMVQVNPRTGAKRPLGLQPAPKDPKPPTEPSEGERKAGGMLQRVRGVAETLNKFDSRKTLDELASRAGMFGNWASSPEGRILRTAGRIWATSVLRPESGATITDQELDAYFEMYLPRPGDDDATLAFKRDQRRIAEEGVATQAGRAAKSSAPPPSQSGSATPAADPASWLQRRRGQP